jgi:predicted polyphosphate/ATP-dependent NAD kinase
VLELGLIVNPVAGLGGPAALRGSDGIDVQAAARARGANPRAARRTARFLATLQSRLGALVSALRFVSWPAPMGAELLTATRFAARVPAGAQARPAVTSEVDTRRAAMALADAGVDLLVFAGGDGTACDVFDAIGRRLPVLGIPTGVKMHSGVFATTPEAAAELVARLVEGGLVGLVEGEVRDADEAELRAGRLAPRFHGILDVPALGGYLQHTKEGGREREDLALVEIAAELAERIRAWSGAVVLGPGSTIAALGHELGVEPTLLGFDVRDADGRWRFDVDRVALDGLRNRHPALVVSFTRRQGFLFGRGNQQLSPGLISDCWPQRVWVAATRTKLASLEGRPLLVDTDDPTLDRRLEGLVTIVSGYRDQLLYTVAQPR